MRFQAVDPMMISPLVERQMRMLHDQTLSTAPFRSSTLIAPLFVKCSLGDSTEGRLPAVGPLGTVRWGCWKDGVQRRWCGESSSRLLFRYVPPQSAMLQGRGRAHHCPEQRQEVRWWWSVWPTEQLPHPDVRTTTTSRVLSHSLAAYQIGTTCNTTPSHNYCSQNYITFNMCFSQPSSQGGPALLPLAELYVGQLRTLAS
jgi:hypothetical protein